MTPPPGISKTALGLPAAAPTVTPAVAAGKVLAELARALPEKEEQGRAALAGAAGRVAVPPPARRRAFPEGGLMRMSAFLTSLVALALLCGRGGGESHEQKGEKMDLAVYAPGDLKWSDAPPVLPRGAKVAVLEGDPSKEGPFVMRVRLPDGYKIPPHTHPKPERVTVISGTFCVGMGARFDETKGKEMPAGSYGTWPAGMTHFVWARGETVIQLHGMGPWSLTYADPKDDPRNAGK